MMRVPRRPAHPRHADPSLLTPTRSWLVVGGFATLIGLGIAGCAAAVGGKPAHSAGARAGTSAPRVIADAPAAQVAIGVDTIGDGVLDGSWFAGPVASSAPGHPKGPEGGPRDSNPASGLAAGGIPTTALTAYKRAVVREAARRPECGLGWPLLAGIGRVESNHGRFAGATLHADGFSTPRIIGIPLDGNGTAVITDTDHGALDGDTRYDRAVGPMQFIPSTWAGWGVDADGDGAKNPNNLFDAAAAAADYLCAAGRNLRTYAGQVQAVRSYNNSDAYIAMVLDLQRTYARGVTTVPTPPRDGSSVPITRRPTLPPVDPGRPRGLPPKKPAPKTDPTTPPNSTTPTGSTRPSTSTTPTEPTTAGTSATPSCSATSPSSSGSTSGSSSAAPATPSCSSTSLSEPPTTSSSAAPTSSGETSAPV